MIVDAAHTAQPIIDAVGGRNVNAVICTHGHNDHVTVAPELAERLHCPVLLHPGDDVLWKMTHPEQPYWRLDDEQRIAIAGTEIQVIHTPGSLAGVGAACTCPRPGHCSPATPCSPAAPAPPAGRIRTFPTIIGSIRDRLFALPEDTQRPHRAR